jgi:hypothetical protein
LRTIANVSPAQQGLHDVTQELLGFAGGIFVAGEIDGDGVAVARKFEANPATDSAAAASDQCDTWHVANKRIALPRGKPLADGRRLAKPRELR